MAPLNTNYQYMFKNMSSGGDIDYKTLISQFGYQGLTAMNGGKDWGAGWFLQAVQSGDTGSAIPAAMNVVANIFADTSTDDVPEANRTNNSDESHIDNTNAKTQELFASVDDALQTIMSACEGNAAKINEALSEIEKLGGNESDIAQKQEELKTKLEEIKAQQQKLNDPNTSSEDRREAIKIILSAVGEIKVMAEEVVAVKSQLEDQQRIVEESSEEVQTLTEEMEQVVEQGSEDAESLSQENLEQMAQDTGKVAESVQKDALGAEQITVGTAMESGPQALVTGSEGAQLIASGTSKIAGGAELMSGAVKDFQGIADVSSNLQQGYQNFTSFAQGIGEYNDGITDLVGAFSANIEPMIKSVGSWETVADTNKALGQYTVGYAQAIGMTEVEEGSDGNVKMDESGTPIYNDEKKQDNLAYQKYEFDMSAFDNAFKVKEG